MFTDISFPGVQLSDRALQRRPRTARLQIFAFLAFLLVFVMSVEGLHAQSQQELDPPREELQYQWKLGGLIGSIAGLFLPDAGSGELVTEAEGGDRLKSELRITSEKSEAGEFWLYGSVIEPSRGRTLKAWSDYLWRGKAKSRSADLDEEQVSDIVSGIHLLRTDPPKETIALRIWSDGKIYPVEVVPGPRSLKSVGERELPARLYTIQGVREPGERFWKGQLDLWLAEDDAATPIEMVIDRKWARVRLTLVESAS